MVDNHLSFYNHTHGGKQWNTTFKRRTLNFRQAIDATILVPVLPASYML